MNLKYPKWTKEEDNFAVNYLKENPDLHCLAKEIAKKRGVIYTGQFLHHIRDRSSSVWKLGLKKLRANKKLNKTMFEIALEPWNKGTKGKGICKPNKGSFKKGHNPLPFNQRIKNINEYRKKQSEAHKGMHSSPATEIKRGQRLSPETEFHKDQFSDSKFVYSYFKGKLFPRTNGSELSDFDKELILVRINLYKLGMRIKDNNED